MEVAWALWEHHGGTAKPEHFGLQEAESHSSFLGENGVYWKK